MDSRKKSATSGKPAKMDIRSVAALARVSIATVSRTINRVPSVDAKIAKRVWSAIEKLQYFPNTQARALVSGRTRLLGLIVSEITNPFFPELIQSFEDAAVSHGYEILISSTNYDPKRVELCVRRMLERNVEGAAVMTFGIEQPMLEQLAARRLPLVFVDVRPERPFTTALVVDYQKGIREAVQHLAVMGHKDIAFISGPLHVHSAHSRLQAFRKAMREIGSRPADELMVEGNHTADGGFEATQKLLLRPAQPTAILCSNDMTALGALRAFQEKGLRVPEDISIIGFDDIHIAQYTAPPLTTIRMSCATLAENAVDALLEHIENRDDRLISTTRSITTSLVVRQTTGYPRGRAEASSTKPKKSKR
jgi:DNA-binding LacI/PurR family transcriptional regulator